MTKDETAIARDFELAVIEKAKRYADESTYSLEQLQELKKKYDSGINKPHGFDTQKQITALAIETAIEWRLIAIEHKKLKE